MLPRSLKKSIYLLFCAITIQICAVAIDLYYQEKSEQLEDQHLNIVDIESSFLKLIALESASNISADQAEDITASYQALYHRMKASKVDLDAMLISQRQSLLGQLSAATNEQRHAHEHINGLLPSLSTSVQYIHEHHIAYQKNLARRGKNFQDYDQESAFERSPVTSAPELDIIQAAIGIQNSMLDTFEVFTRLQRGYSPSDVNKEFSEKIGLFYEAINKFEDYSLDAQDGLLVEELLINGRIFEESYRRFLNLEQQQQSLTAHLNINQNKFI